MGHLWASLVAAGLYRDLLATGVATAAGHVVLWRPWRAHRRTQQLIADRLDASTPGGLGGLTGEGMAKIIKTGEQTPTSPVTGHTANSVDTHPADHPKPASGGGGTK